MVRRTRDGGHVRLAEVAEVRIVPTPNHIENEHTARRYDVSANVRGRDLGAVAADVERTLKEFNFPLGYHAEVIGEEAERRAAQRRLLIVAAVAAVGILLLLQLAVGTWRLAGLAFLLLPAALVGGVVAAYFGGGVISLGSLVGFLTVLGISARNGILLIDHCRHLERYEGARAPSSSSVYSDDFGSYERMVAGRRTHASDSASISLEAPASTSTVSRLARACRRPHPCI